MPMMIVEVRRPLPQIYTDPFISTLKKLIKYRKLKLW